MCKGRRYRRADEIGVPFCVTVDFDSVSSFHSSTSSATTSIPDSVGDVDSGMDADVGKSGSVDNNVDVSNVSVTVRMRDSMRQERMTVKQLLYILHTQVHQ